MIIVTIKKTRQRLEKGKLMRKGANILFISPISADSRDLK